MSVVASYLHWTRTVAGVRASPHHERVRLQIAGQGSRAVTRRTVLPLPPDYPIGLAEQKKLVVKMSLIIVNGQAVVQALFLLLFAFPLLS
jgi:hypothetical protein